MDLTRGVSVLMEGEPERYFLLRECLKLTAVLNEPVSGEPASLSCGVAYYDPTPMDAWTTTGECLLMMVQSVKGETMSPLIPRPLIRIQGTDLYTGKRVVWLTMWCDVLVQDATGKLLN